jgi:hypothetical protein
MVERFFTPKEANQILPDVRKIVEEILFAAHESPIPEQRIKALMARLEDMGCYYKDWNFEIGLVDFPAIINGQQALLCWRSDEDQVEWFHGYEDGYSGRRKVTRELIFS